MISIQCVPTTDSHGWPAAKHKAPSNDLPNWHVSCKIVIHFDGDMTRASPQYLPWQIIWCVCHPLHFLSSLFSNIGCGSQIPRRAYAWCMPHLQPQQKIHPSNNRRNPGWPLVQDLLVIRSIFFTFFYVSDCNLKGWPSVKHTAFFTRGITPKCMSLGKALFSGHYSWPTIVCFSEIKYTYTTNIASCSALNQIPVHFFPSLSWCKAWASGIECSHCTSEPSGTCLSSSFVMRFLVLMLISPLQVAPPTCHDLALDTIPPHLSIKKHFMLQPTL